jgi:hypothetical protein
MTSTPTQAEGSIALRLLSIGCGTGCASSSAIAPCVAVDDSRAQPVPGARAHQVQHCARRGDHHARAFGGGACFGFRSRDVAQRLGRRPFGCRAETSGFVDGGLFWWRQRARQLSGALDATRLGSGRGGSEALRRHGLCGGGGLPPQRGRRASWGLGIGGHRRMTRWRRPRRR